MDLVSASHKHQVGSLSSIILLITHQGARRSSFLRAWKAIHGRYTGPPGAARVGHRCPAPPRLRQGQEGHAAPHSPSAWETAALFALPKTLVLFIFPAVGCTDEEQGLQAPGVSSLVSKGKFQ